MRFKVLGSIDVERDGGSVTVGGPQQRRLLGVLLIGRGHTVSADRLVETLWPNGDAPGGATRSVMTYVSRLRAALGDGHIVTNGPGYRLTCDRATFDVDEFEALVTEAESALPDRALECYDRALALWHGQEAFGEFAGEWWALAESTRLAELRLVAREEQASALIAIGHHGRAVPDLESLIVEHPLRERPVSLLMHALVATGRQAEALRVFRSYRTRLVEETGLDPSPDLVQLERTISGSVEPAGDASLGRPLRGYTIHEAIGEGAYGRVYSATQPGTERRVAIKVVRPDLADSAEFIRRFEAEARLVARLEHPHIVPLYDYWREPGGAYLVFRFLGGGTARASVIAGGPWSLPRVSQLVEEVGGALIAAHAAGVWHNDVKSSNVMLDERGSAYLTDFGIAATSGAGGARDDIRGFGWVLWELLTGESPVAGSATPSIVGLAAAVPEGLDAVLARATDPDGGYANVAELVLGWRAAVGRPEGVLSPVTSSERRTVDSARRAAARQLTKTTAAGVNPYKGLRPFDEADAAEFFGRDAVCDELEEAVGSHRLVTVVGASGSGKSSLVRAGLVPRLRSSGHTVVTMVPGDDPVGALRQALSEVASRRGRANDLVALVGHVVVESGPLVVMIDQFEELWTRADRQRRAEFVELVARLVDGPDARLVATIRADVFDRPLQEPRLGEHIRDGAFVLAPLSPAQLGDAITLPAARTGVTVDEAVVADLVTEAAAQPGSLPLLQFTLAELYDRRVDGRVGEDALSAVGGMAGSIGRRAEEVYLADAGRAQSDTRELFSRLVTPGDGVPDARRRARLSELSDGGRAVADAYVAARLLVTDRDPATREPTVEVAHEALLTRWPRLAEWIDADRRWLTQLQHLAAAARAWDERDRPAADVYRGARLEAAIEAIDTEGRIVSDVERQFVDAGRGARDSELEAARKSARRLRRLLVGVGALLVMALVAGGLALVAQRRANRQEREANRERRVATARELAAAADANLADDPERSMLLALAAIDETRSNDEPVLPEATNALHRAVTASRIVLSVPGVGGSLDWSPAGTIFVTEGPEDSGLIDIRDATTGASVHSFRGHDDDVNGVAFSSDGSMLATTGDDSAVRVWDPATGDKLFEFTGEKGGQVHGPSFSPDGSRLAASWTHQHLVRVIDLTTGKVITELDVENPWRTAFSPDGQRLAIGRTFAQEAAVVDVTSGENIFTLRGDDSIMQAEWSPDGRWIATVGFDAKARLWDADTGEQRFTMSRHTAPVVALDWSPDSSRLATVSNDGTALISEIADDGVGELFSFAAQDTSGGLNGVAFSPDGQRLMTGDNAITAVKIWDARPTGGGEWANVPVEQSSWVDFTPDGRSLVALSAAGSPSIVNLQTGERLESFSAAAGGDDDVAHLDLSDDGQLLATSGWGGPVNVWDASTGAHRFAVSAVDIDGTDDEWVQGVQWSPTGDLLAIIVYRDGQGEVVVVDHAGVELGTVREKPGQVIPSVSFSPDGRLLATTREGLEQIVPADMDVTIWDWERGEVVRTIDTSAQFVAFDPTGTRVATSRRVEGIADVWDALTGDNVATLSAVSPIGDITFSPDGTSVATGHNDGAVRLWDPETGVQQLVVGGDVSAVTNVAFSADGSKLASIGTDGLARVWALDLDDLIAIAEERLTRTLSDSECRQYLHLDRCLDV